MIELSSDMHGFFKERLATAFSRRALTTCAATEAYLVDLLATYATTPAEEALGKPFVHLLAEAIETPSPGERFRKFREMGDGALYVCGFFSEHLDRRGVSRNYVVSMGGRAYNAAGDLALRPFGGGQAAFAEVFPDLATRFDLFAHVLDEVRETTALRTPQDIIRLYERWQRTKSPMLAQRLEQAGVFPQIAASRGNKLVH